MITLHQPPRTWGLPNMSPFCAKLETYLRMTGVEYKLKGGNITEAPNGRVPYVKIDGKVMGDSTLIIEHLKKTHGDRLDSGLSPEQKALSQAVKGMVEDHLYFAAAALRWMDEGSLAHVRKAFLGFLPPVIGALIFDKLIRKDLVKLVKAHGMGQHPREVILKFAMDDLTAVSTLLGDKPFFHGAEPTTIDATLYGFLIQVLWVPWDNELKQHALALKNLEPYCQRMKQKYFADFK
ncbi:MAG: glutathione S-transferase family protein [Bdellovibrionia bacterium]